jgi:hypothetical protein
VKEAAVTVPAVAGRVTLPVLVRVPPVARITVPPAPDATAILPKLMSAFFEMLMGVTMVAVAVAGAVAWANAPPAHDMININVARILFL